MSHHGKVTRTVVTMVSGRTHVLDLTDKQIYTLVQRIGVPHSVFIYDRTDESRVILPTDHVESIEHAYTDMSDGSV